MRSMHSRYIHYLNSAIVKYKHTYSIIKKLNEKGKNPMFWHRNLGLEPKPRFSAKPRIEHIKPGFC